MQIIYHKDELLDLLNTVETIIVYGAGLVANVILKYILEHTDTADKVFCVAVTDKKNNPDMILGVPVCSLDDLYEYNDALYIIATLEGYHHDIAQRLKNNQMCNIAAISNVFYACVRKETADYIYDILQNTYRTKLQTNEIKEVLYRLQYKLEQVETCIQYGTRTYQETLMPHQYERELKKWYKYKTGNELDLLKPITYNEKIQWIKLYGITPLMTKLSDKWEVRDWIRSKLGEEYLIPLLGKWDTFDEINFDELPEKFVIKCTHGSGWNIVVTDKASLDIDNAKKHFDSWMNLNFAFIGGLELQYKNIQPRIIAEKYIENIEGDLYDYKFWCFQGKVEFIMFLSERGDELKMDNFDKNWNLLPFVYGHPNSGKEIMKPDNLQKMIDIAETLATGFEHVRVDLYLLNDGTIKFGEMTFTSCSGICPWNREDINIKLGKLISCI